MKLKIEGNNNIVEIDKLNVPSLCEKCSNKIYAGKYHLILLLNFKYYGYKSRNFTEKKRKNVMGTLRMHFDCFEKLTNTLIEVGKNMEELKTELVAKTL